ncbi:hypothetical protein CALCODRAFT_480628 [Calocera cornea HHB12733]|uniref:Transcription and mRNA export factor SUS1 n=1 Tax=Calocera cornea HHB12733 TaxID=1353952 RepID=A0A165IGD3_9BASI|nr:hypothetical protein CALCODRAFT_480628 [Calocera cornea HHB12733]
MSDSGRSARSGSGSSTAASVSATSASASAATGAGAAREGEDGVDPELWAAVQARLLRSGEWIRLQTALRHKLLECGYLDDLLSLALSTTTTPTSPPGQTHTFPSLLASVQSYGTGRLPDGVRREVEGLLGEWLERNLRAG